MEPVQNLHAEFYNKVSPHGTLSGKRPRRRAWGDSGGFFKSRAANIVRRAQLQAVVGQKTPPAADSIDPAIMVLQHFTSSPITKTHATDVTPNPYNSTRSSTSILESARLHVAQTLSLLTSHTVVPMYRKMIKTKCDSRGRLYLRDVIRSRFGEEFIVVETKDGVLLLPVPSDPVADLASIGKALSGLSIDEIKKGIAQRAQEDAGA